ncbi:MAG: SEC-C domain-containing protein [Deltaproteobacteria bacterium]|nr:SEC-C domain-containing protein [Deltaproteobacteria bacterium]MBW1956291.1 SEC-C domain-containing protein [Deltaproteobacteria bacterium]
MKRIKICRNDPCPCGSGLKYKKGGSSRPGSPS